MIAEDYLLAIDQLEARLMQLDARLTEIAQKEPYREAVGWLRCFRGIDTLTAILILAELHDFRRFQPARALMAYLGLVSGEDSSGVKTSARPDPADLHSPGPTAAGGDGLARSASAEHRRRPDVTTQRTTGPRDCDCRQAQQRLCRRFRCLVAQQKPAPKTAVAIARELAAFLWAALQRAPTSVS